MRSSGVKNSQHGGKTVSGTWDVGGAEARTVRVEKRKIGRERIRTAEEGRLLCRILTKSASVIVHCRRS